MTVPQVTVVLPLFGSHRAAETLPAVSRAWLRQDVACEVVVAVAGEELAGHLRDSLQPGVRLVVADTAITSAGPLRNLAAAAAQAPALYLGDADIAPLGTDFLRRAERLRAGGAVIQPWMYRLINARKLRDVPAFEDPGRGRVCHVRGDLDGRLTPVPGERFIRLGSDLMYVEPMLGTGPDESDDRWRKPPFHWGGFLLDRKLFDDVGGYCERYVGWGCEDDDLIVKIEARATVIRAWRVARRLTCLHFEHPRSYTESELVANQSILADRCAAGVDAMIEEDL